MTRMDSNEGASEYAGPPPDEHTACIQSFDPADYEGDFFYGGGYIEGGVRHIGVWLGLWDAPEGFREQDRPRDGYPDSGIHPE